MSKKYCKLIMVAVGKGSASQSNKFYEMQWDGKSPNFTVNFGRVESTVQTTSYPIGKWESKYNEKVAKGYKDVTSMVAVSDTTSLTDVGNISDKKVSEFITLMKRYTDNLVSNTYSVKAENVTAAQVTEAQSIINKLTKVPSNEVNRFNSYLFDLYTIIPRRMKDVRQFLVPSVDPKIVITVEQDNLDAISSQISLISPVKKGKKRKSILDDIGIKMKETSTNGEIQYLIDQMSRAGKRVEAIFSAQKDSEDHIFDTWMSSQKNKQTRILIHGTRNTSVIPILQTNLKIRPAGNFQFSGKVYGEGNYFSETVSKSLGYTGGDRDKVLLVYEVHTGNPFVYNGWFRGNSFTLNYKNLSERGFDSTFVKAGNGLLNSEIIVYTEKQNRLKYILWLQ